MTAIILNLVLYGLLAVVVWEDFTYRGVHWYIFPIIFVCCILIDLSGSLNWVPGTFQINLFLLLQILTASLYFTVKKRYLVNIFKNHFGLGDLLFLVSISPMFSIFNFIAFYIISLIVITIFYVGFLSYKKYPNQYPIPLAGMQSALFMLFLIFNAIFSTANLHDDACILGYLKI